jgi:hypothetical protein
MRIPFVRLADLARSSLGVLAGLVVGAIAGCNGSAGIPNLTRSAPPLPAMDVYSGPRMNIPRYSHSATTLEDGTVLVIGGTDENHLTAIDRVEIFDQAARVDSTDPIPESIAGDFLDQDIDGNLITLTNGGRFFHSATGIEDGNVLIIGGTTSIFFGISIEASEIYDPLTRTFGATQLQIDPADDIEDARARHSAIRLPNGRVIVSGGQEAETVVVPGGGQIGGIPVQQTQEARASTKSVEVFDPATLAFSPVIDNSGFTSQLTTSRGRAGHASAQWAGFDNQFNSGDDVIGFIGGFMTLSALSLGAPEDYFPWSPLTTKLNSMDFFDSTTRTISLAQGIVLTKRSNDAIAVNLGQDHSHTPFGDPGLANAVFVVGGDSDEGCPDGPSTEGTADDADLIIATFTGFGPANGARFTSIPPGIVVGVSSFTHCAETVAWGVLNMIPCPTLNRSRTGAVLMDMVRTYDGQNHIVSVVVSGGGSDQTDTPGGCAQNAVGFCAEELKGFQFFDPFYDIGQIPDLIDDPDADGVPDLFPWAFESNETVLNPLGLRGCILNYDTTIPSETIAGFADTPVTVAMGQARLMHTLSRVAGEDGLIGNIDDRVVAIGGTGVYGPLYGAEALSISCEIFLPPDAGIIAP